LFAHISTLKLPPRIFEIAPEASALFKFAANGIDDDMYKSPIFLVHARGVIRTVNAAVNLLEAENMDKLVEILKDLGARHATYNVKEAHYPIVGEALLDTLGKALGEGFTPEVKEAWTGVYGVIADTMCQGAKEGLE
jgi:hemoglobin-like flavoprotein